MTAAGKCITITVASVAAITAPAAQAAPPSISPGDRIDYITDEGSASFCTVGLGIDQPPTPPSASG